MNLYNYDFKCRESYKPEPINVINEICDKSILKKDCVHEKKNVKFGDTLNIYEFV